MTDARRRALELAPNGDLVARLLAGYLQTHLKEEQGHDLWLLDDIRTLGYRDDQIIHALPCAATINLIGAQYFWMNQTHPVTVMGYLTVMEGYAPLTSQLDKIRARAGAPETAFRCLRRHADDDPAHSAELSRVLDSMPLNDEQTRAIGLSAFATIEWLSAVFEELLAGLSLDVLAGLSKESRHVLA